MELVCQLCLPRQAYALGHTHELASLCGRLYRRTGNGFCSRRGAVGKLSHQTRMAAIKSNSIRSKASEACVEPLRLLPSTKSYSNLSASLEEELRSAPESSQSLYRVELTTSNASSSDLSDRNAGILVCIIGENGNSIIRKIPAISPAPQILSSDMSNLEEQISDCLCFQRGSVDIVTFWGPDIGRLSEIWIGPESGSWRLGRANILVIRSSESGNNGIDNKGKVTAVDGMYYVFQTSDVMLGEGGDSAAVLRPSQVQELSGSDIWMKFPTTNTLATVAFSKDVKILQQESLKDYEDLKFSLLLYDAILVASGTSIAAIAGSQEISRGFAIGGVLGFLYLLLLQGAVDRLPGPSINKSSIQDNYVSGESNVENQGQDIKMKLTNLSTNTQVEIKTESFQDSFAGFRGPLTRLSWIIAILFITSRYANGNIMISLKPPVLLGGAAGFLTSKVSAVIAAFRTIPIDRND